MSNDNNKLLYLTCIEQFDSNFQQSDVKLIFDDNSSADSIDVSFIINGSNPNKYEGILLQSGKRPRFGFENEAIDRWPGDGDWFYTHDELRDEFESFNKKSEDNNESSDEDNNESSDEDNNESSDENDK